MASFRKPRDQPPGLINKTRQNLCSINVVLQMLASTPLLSESLVRETPRIKVTTWLCHCRQPCSLKVHPNSYRLRVMQYLPRVMLVIHTMLRQKRIIQILVAVIWCYHSKVFLLFVSDLYFWSTHISHLETPKYIQLAPFDHLCKCKQVTPIAVKLTLGSICLISSRTYINIWLCIMKLSIYMYIMLLADLKGGFSRQVRLCTYFEYTMYLYFPKQLKGSYLAVL